MDESVQRAIGVAVMMVLIAVGWLALMKILYWLSFLAGRIWRNHAKKARVGANASE